MNKRREPLLTDLIFMLCGVAAIAIAISSLDNSIEYLPNDIRSQPWFYPLVSSIQALLGVILFVVGAVRLMHGLRDRNKHD